MSLLSTPRRTAMFCARSDSYSRSDSESESAVGIETMANSDSFSSCRRSCSCCICPLNFLSARTAFGSPSVGGAALGFLSLPKTRPSSSLAPPSTLVAELKRVRSASTRSMNRTRKSGKVSNLSVCPVGAVSMITLSKWTPSESSRANATTFARAMSSSTPGGTVSSTSAKSERSRLPPPGPLTTPLSSVLNSSSASSTLISTA
mmetsp:Transcript_28396/g.62181  ORF Transcript_28396/g.62181 Transcript_28396/m.62181 type:complete len:204 (-) Transcript_28396:1702-2313(-)